MASEIVICRRETDSFHISIIMMESYETVLGNLVTLSPSMASSVHQLQLAGAFPGLGQPSMVEQGSRIPLTDIDAVYTTTSVATVTFYRGKDLFGESGYNLGGRRVCFT